MWMVESNDEMTKELKTINPTKLRPLMPKITSSSSPSCSCNIRNPNILQWTHPISGGLGEYGMVRQSVPLVSTRWNPTPEQLQALEEMYRRGIRTPSAEQIQQIASKLRRFGKIEGKNVFYWFQNHKARERQKKRRQLHDHHHLIPKQPTPPGVGKRYMEIEHHKKLGTASTPSEDSASMQAAAAAAAGWTQPQPQPHKISSALTTTNTLSQYQYTNTIFLPKQNRTTTLQLFPINDNVSSSDDVLLETKFGATQFIEFLPTKI